MPDVVVSHLLRLSPSVSQELPFTPLPHSGVIALLPNWFISVRGSLWLSVRERSPPSEACQRQLEDDSWRGKWSPTTRSPDGPVLISSPTALRGCRGHHATGDIHPGLRLPATHPPLCSQDPGPAPSLHGAVASPRNDGLGTERGPESLMSPPIP